MNNYNLDIKSKDDNIEILIKYIKEGKMSDISKELENLNNKGINFGMCLSRGFKIYNNRMEFTSLCSLYGAKVCCKIAS